MRRSRQQPPRREACVNALSTARTTPIGLSLEIFNRVFGNWQKQYGDEFLEKVRIVVTGSPMPRKQILAVSYFARKLKQIGESARLV